MNARDVDMAAADVERSRHRARRCLVTGGVVAAIAVAVLPMSSGFAIALGVGAALQLSAAVLLWLSRRERIERLALDPSAYAIPEVARFGARVCALRERRRLAAFIDAVVHDRGSPSSCTWWRAPPYTDSSSTRWRASWPRPPRAWSRRWRSPAAAC
jgi:hypothetical protein